MSPAARPASGIAKLDARGAAAATRALAHRAAPDARMRALVRRVGPCPLRATGRPYAYLVRSVLYQQLAGAAAAAIERRFLALFDGRTPRPEALARAGDARLRSAGLSGGKARALRSIGEAFASGAVRERRLWHLDDDAVVRALSSIHGVGAWTAHMVLMHALGRPDVLPVGDYGVRKGAQQLYGLDALPAPRELEAIAGAWQPYRSVAAWYLWRHDAIAELAHEEIAEERASGPRRR